MSAIRAYDAVATAQLLPFRRLVGKIAVAALQFERGDITCPPRMVMPLSSDGIFLSMPAAAGDIVVHKLVTIQPQNRGTTLPTVQGLMTVCNAQTGAPLFMLDGQVVTGRRTAAVTLLAIEKLLAKPPKRVVIVGTGTQAKFHVQAIRELLPTCAVLIKGLSAQHSTSFCADPSLKSEWLKPHSGDFLKDADVVITLTTSCEPIYNDAGIPHRLVVGVGAFRPDMAEIGPLTLADSALYADDVQGARHEAGDLIQAGVDWTTVRSLSAAVRGDAEYERPIVFKSVGCAAWDLAAGRVALENLGGREPIPFLREAL